MFTFLDDLSEYKRGRKKGSKDKVKRISNILEPIKVSQRIASTGTHISREIRGWHKLIQKAKQAKNFFGV